MAKSECVHHWLIGRPVINYENPGMKGDLVETTEQVCKKCDEHRTNTVVLPAEQVI